MNLTRMEIEALIEMVENKTKDKVGSDSESILFENLQEKLEALLLKQ